MISRGACWCCSPVWCLHVVDSTNPSTHPPSQACLIITHTRAPQAHHRAETVCASWPRQQCCQPGHAHACKTECSTTKGPGGTPFAVHQARANIRLQAAAADHRTSPCTPQLNTRLTARSPNQHCSRLGVLDAAAFYMCCYRTTGAGFMALSSTASLLAKGATPKIYSSTGFAERWHNSTSSTAAVSRALRV